MKKICLSVRKCRICGNHLEEILDYGEMPLAGGFVLEDDERADWKFPLHLMWCDACFLLQTGESIPPDIMFKEYSYSSKFSPLLINHFRWSARELLRKNPFGLIIDIGCNDGILLDEFIALGKKKTDLLGIDPSDVARSSSEQSGWLLENDYLSIPVALSIVERYGKARIINASNVFAHNDDLHTLAESISILLDDTGIFCCEVHDVNKLIDYIQFDCVYHEHSVYYSVSALTRLFAMYDLSVDHVEKIPMHGGSLRVIFKKGQSNLKRLPSEQSLPAKVQSFRNKSLDIQRKLFETVDLFESKGFEIWAYGASGRCTVLLNICNLGEKVRYVVDRSDLRVGKVVPGVHVPIIHEEEFRSTPPEWTLVTAWPHFQSIRDRHSDYTGRWIIPLPEVKVLV